MRRVFLSIAVAALAIFLGSNLFGYSWFFLPYHEYTIPGYPSMGSTAIGDVNGDGLNDIVVNTVDDHTGVSHVAILSQTASGQISAWTLYRMDDNIRLYSSSLGDVNNDGRTDVIVGGQEYDSETGEPADTFLGVLLQNQWGTLDAMQIYPWTRFNTLYPKAADMNNDGLADVVGMGWQGNSISIRYQDGEGTLSKEVVYEIPPDQYNYFVPADINNDGLIDIVAMTRTGLQIFVRNHDGTFQPPYFRGLSEDFRIYGLAVGDVNGDSLNDIVASFNSDSSGPRIAVIYQTPSGTLGPLNLQPCYAMPTSVKIADVNLDGRNDIVVIHAYWYAFGVFLQNPDGTMLPEELYPFARSQNGSPDALAIGDVNSDGLPDVVYGDHADNRGAIVALHSKGYSTITVALEGGGTGGVIDSSGTISCSYSSGGHYCASGIWKGFPISFYAKPDKGSRFAGWAGSCSGIGPCNLTTGGDIALTAFFERQTALTIKLWSDGWEYGMVTSSPPGIECGSRGLFCTYTFDKGTSVTLTPHAAPGATFIGWNETWLCPGQGECTLVMDSDKELNLGFVYCTYSLFPSHVAFPAAGGSTTVYATIIRSGSSMCAVPYPVEDCSWLKGHLTDPKGITIGLDADDNRSGLPRTCTVTAGGQPVVVTQDGASCSVLSLKPLSQTLPSTEASGAFLVKTTLGDCPWTASTQSPWIHITSPQGTGEGRVTFALDANTGKATRTGTISVRSVSTPAVEKIFTVRQKPGKKAGMRVPAGREETGNGIKGPFYENLFRPYVLFDPGSNILAIAVGDINNDGRKDIVALTMEDLFVYLQDDKGNLREPIRYEGSIGYAESIDVADVNGDGRDDVVVAYCGLKVYLQNSNGTLDPPIFYPSPAPSGYCFADLVKTGDFDNDGRIDVAAIGSHNKSVAAGVWYQNASGTLDPPLFYYVPYWGKGEIDAADVTGDGRTDLLVMSGQYSGAPNVTILPQTPEGTLDAPFQYDLYDTLTWGMAAGDVNGDGLKDVVQTTWDGFIGVFLQGQDGRLQEPLVYPTLDRGVEDGIRIELGSVAVGDLDGDGRDDIAFLYQLYPYLGVFLQDTNGGLREEQRYRVPGDYYYSNPKALIVADVNGDGFNDLVIGENQSGVVILYNMGNTRLLSVKKTGEGQGSVVSYPDGIDCGTSCTKGYPIGTTVTLTAKTGADSVFTGWSGASCAGTGPCVLTVTNDIDVQAVFSRSCAYSISPSRITEPFAGGTMEVEIGATGAASCPKPVVRVPYDWIEISAVSWKDNRGTIRIVTAENDSTVPRSANIPVYGTWLTVYQEGIPCRVTMFGAVYRSYGREGGKSRAWVGTDSRDECPWILSVSAPWIRIEPSYGRGNYNTITLSVDPNTTNMPRSAVVTAASQSQPQKKKTLIIRQK